MFGVLRDILGLLILVMVFFLLKIKFKVRFKTPGYAALIVGYFIIVAFLDNVPIENAFMTFSSAQEAFKYNNKTGEVICEIEGEESTLIRISDDTVDYFADEYFIVPKTDCGWKMGMWYDTNLILDQTFGDMNIHVWQYKDSDDYYISVVTNKVEIADNRNSEFQYTVADGEEVKNELEEFHQITKKIDGTTDEEYEEQYRQYKQAIMEELDRPIYTYYAYVEGFDDQYSITVDGREIKLEISKTQ